MTNLRLSYQTVEFGKTDIHLCTLRNKQEFHDPAGIAEKLGICSASWPIFGVIWPSSLVLAHFIFDYETGSKTNTGNWMWYGTIQFASKRTMR